MRLIVGALVAGAAMWVLGFVLYGVFFGMGYGSAPDATQLAIQTALKALPASGTYLIPVGDTPALARAYAAGPVAQISYNAGGFPMADWRVFVGGYVQFAVVAAMLGLLLRGLGDRVDGLGRARVVIGLAAIAVVYIHFADPIWLHGDWKHALWTSFADMVVLGTGGLIMARWFVARR